MSMRAMVVLSLVAGMTAAAAGQQKPDFSGTWRVAKDATTTVAAAPSPVFGEVFAMRHTGQRVGRLLVDGGHCSGVGLLAVGRSGHADDETR